ncbi:hypothetical protein ABMX48_12755 [Streptomyces cavourensis]
MLQAGPDHHRARPAASQAEFGRTADRLQPRQVGPRATGHQVTARHRTADQGRGQLGEHPGVRFVQHPGPAVGEHRDTGQGLGQRPYVSTRADPVDVHECRARPAPVLAPQPAQGLLLRDQHRRQPREQPGVIRLGRRVADPGHRAHQPLRGGGGQEHGQRGVFGGRRGGLPSVQPARQRLGVGPRLRHAAHGGDEPEARPYADRHRYRRLCRLLPLSGARGPVVPGGDDQELPVGQLRRLHDLCAETGTVQRPCGGAGERAVRVRAEDPRSAARERGTRSGGPVGHGPEPRPGTAPGLSARALDQQVVVQQLADEGEQRAPERRPRRGRPYQLRAGGPAPLLVRCQRLGQTPPEHRQTVPALQREAGDPAPQMHAVVEHGLRHAGP